jgi:DNA segregation ATPase FtsK/SpoIIIE-like protein
MTIVKKEVIQLDEKLICEAIFILTREQQVSIALLQRHLRLGYSITCQLMQILEFRGVVRYFNSAGIRELSTSFRRKENENRFFDFGA